MPKIWRKAIEQELDEKDVELLNILAEERKFEEKEIKDFAKKLKISIQEVKKKIEKYCFKPYLEQPLLAT